MANNPKHMLKPEAPAHKPTKEEQAQQIARFFSQKREQYFSLILGNTLQNPNCKLDLETCVDLALKAADHAIEKLYPLPAEPKQEEAK